MINNILLIVAVFNIILSIIVIILSTVRKRKRDGSTHLERNLPGIYSGIIIMIFSVCFLVLLLIGKISVEDYNDIAFWGIGGMFFVCGVVLILGFVNINQVEMFSVGNLPTIAPKKTQTEVGIGFPNGICEKDGIYGTLMSNGVCVIPQERLENCKENAVAAYKDKVKEQEARENAKKCESKNMNKLKDAKEDFKEVSRGDIDGNKVNNSVNNLIRMPVIAGHYPAGTSLKNFRHFEQYFHSGKFRKFDYGQAENL